MTYSTLETNNQPKSCINQEKACFSNSKNACKNPVPRLSILAPQCCSHGNTIVVAECRQFHMNTKPNPGNNIEQHIKTNQSNMVNKSHTLISTLSNNRGKISKYKSTYTHLKLTFMPLIMN